MNNPSQTEQLLSAILEHSWVSMLSVPFFSPNDNPDSFVAMYRRVLEATDGDLVFSLLTKVNVFCLELVALISLLQCKNKFCIQLEIFNQAKLCSCQEPALRVGTASLKS